MSVKYDLLGLTAASGYSNAPAFLRLMPFPSCLKQYCIWTSRHISAHKIIEFFLFEPPDTCQLMKLLNFVIVKSQDILDR